MNSNDLLEIAEEFFQQINPNFCEDYFEKIDFVELWEVCEDFFYQFRQQV